MDMNTINWKQKLSSRKFWVGIILLGIGAGLCIYGDVENGMKLIVIGAGGYLGTETIVDVARTIFTTHVIENTVIPEADEEKHEVE